MKSFEPTLFINTKKELTVGKSKPFDFLEDNYTRDGSATENRTPVTGMKILCPNH